MASRDSKDDELKKLWWAHTGGGSGNFGVVTRFWFREPPIMPSYVLLTGLAWDWADVTEDDFTAILTAFGTYFQDNQDPTKAAGKLFGILVLTHVCNGQIGLFAQVDVDDPQGKQAMDDFLRVMQGGVSAPAKVMRSPMGERPTLAHMQIPRVMPWLTATQALDSSGENQCGKYKSAYIRKPFSPGQIDTMWSYLGNEAFVDYTNKNSLIQIDSYGSAINKPPRDTAARQRDSIMKMQFQTYWTRTDPKEAEYLDWIRKTYKATFRETDGVPTVGKDITDGCYINYPDVDLGDPEWNESDQTWSTLYYKDAYPTLQEIKDYWDPNNVFRSAQSIQPLVS